MGALVRHPRRPQVDQPVAGREDHHHDNRGAGPELPRGQSGTARTHRQGAETTGKRGEISAGPLGDFARAAHLGHLHPRSVTSMLTHRGWWFFLMVLAFLTVGLAAGAGTVTLIV